MFLKRSLLRWYSKRVSSVTTAATALALFVVLFWQQQPFAASQMLPWLFLFIHGLCLNWRLGQFNNPTDAFLYTRGFSRDTLYFHRTLAIVLHVLIPWAAVSLSIWTGLRSWTQRHIAGNPEFPMMDGVDARVPLDWLIGYGVVMCILQYATIRRRQPTRGVSAGRFLIAAQFVAGFTVINMAGPREWLTWVTLLSLIILATASLWGGWQLHRRMEVRA